MIVGHYIYLVIARPYLLVRATIEQFLPTMVNLHSVAIIGQIGAKNGPSL